MKKSSNNVAIYCRISTDSQQPIINLEAQEILCREYAKNHGYKVTKVVSEVASGNDTQRRGLRTLFDYLRKRRIPQIIVFDENRLARNYQSLRFVLKELKRCKAYVCSVKNEPIRTQHFLEKVRQIYLRHLKKK